MTVRLRTALFLVLGLILVAASPLLLHPSAARAGVNDFSYASWDARYEVGLDASGRSTLHVTETLVARFPDIDQNRGIVRGLAETYRGAPLLTDVRSVTDGQGRSVPFSTDENDDVLMISIGGDDFQHGLTTYVIDYTMRDVFHRPDNADVDEFYWDLLPLDSTQPIERFTGTVSFAPDLAARMTGDRSCYRGLYGATDRCTITPGADGASFTLAEQDLPAGAGVTVAFAFAPGTVAPSPATQSDPMTDAVPYAAAGGGLLVAAGGGFTALALLRRKHRRLGRGIVVAQYDVPADLPPLIGAVLLGAGSGAPPNAVPAEIVHLAVRRAIRIEDGDDKPVLAINAPVPLGDPLDGEALKALFPVVQEDATVDLATPNDALAVRLSVLPKHARTAAVERGLVERRRSAPGALLGGLGVLLGLVGIALSIPGIVVQRPAAIVAFVVSILITVGALIVALVLLQKYVVLTAAGAERLEYLQGVREYVRLAEADRIRMLQSYRGAERRQDGSADVVVLYERLLPYAMLFGMEKEWGEVLAVQYEQTRTGPTWYDGYVAGSLGASLARMQSSLSATPTPSTSSSSSSSGSFGGGFSGGGGGGGFSGGR